MMLGKILFAVVAVANVAGALATEGCDPDNGGKAKTVKIKTEFASDGLHKVGRYKGTIKAENPTKKCVWKTMARNPTTGKFSLVARGTENKKKADLTKATHFETYGCGKWVKP